MHLIYHKKSYLAVGSALRFGFLGFTLIFLLAGAQNAQAQNRCKKCNFGFDGETITDTMVSGSGLGIGKGSDDWFNGPVTGPGMFAIDTTGAWAERVYWSGGAQRFFKRQGWFAPYHKEKGKTWIWAAYLRDYISGPGYNDSSCFLTANKNGWDPPKQWQGGTGSVNAKSDIIDGGVLIARDGLNSSDSLYLFGFVATRGTSGNRFFDYELYKAEGSYNPVTGKFSNTGPDSGHTAWKFVNGVVKAYGDIIVAVTKGSTGVQLLDLRIWMRRSTFDSMNLYPSYRPTQFSIDYAKFDGPSSTSAYGYASITYSGTGYICGEENDAITYSPVPPFGSINSSSTFVTTNYDQSQYIEFALNLTKMGIDPYEFQGLSSDDWCNAGFGSVMIKTRQSGSSFTSNMDDFVGPASFVLPPATIAANGTGYTCVSSSPFAQVTNNTGNNANLYYEWVKTPALSTVLDTGIYFTPTSSGTYRVYAMRGDGCRRLDSVTIVIGNDNQAPVATVVPVLDSVWIPGKPATVFVGGDSAASILLTGGTGFGASQGLSWAWTGPGGYSASTKNITVGVNQNMGKYVLRVTELRNGCWDTASALLILLPVDLGYFGCSPADQAVKINWTTLQENSVSHFEVQRLINNRFVTIGKMASAGNSDIQQQYSLLDNSPEKGMNYYRLKVVNLNGSAEYSTPCNVSMGQDITAEGLAVMPNPASTDLDVSFQAHDGEVVTIAVVDQTGRAVKNLQLAANEGRNLQSISVASLRPGIYFLQLSSQGRIESLKFYKK